MNGIPDPATTFSGRLPTLPPPAARDNGGPLTVLDPRFPIRLSEPARIFWQLTSEWPDRETVIGETIRATQQHTDREERFVQPLTGTQPIPAITAPIVYPELGPAALADDWDTQPGTAILTGGEEPRKHRRRGAGGRFIPGEA